VDVDGAAGADAGAGRRADRYGVRVGLPLAAGRHAREPRAQPVGRPEPALHHARRCLDWCEAHPEALEDWDLAYAHEALARAFALAGEPEEARRHAALARELAAGVAGAKDREHLDTDLATLPV
jgi:hypothetical protein